MEMEIERSGIRTERDIERRVERRMRVLSVPSPGASTSTLAT